MVSGDPGKKSNSKQGRGAETNRDTDYERPVMKSPSLHGQKSNSNPKFLGTAEAYFVCHIGPKFQISLIYAFIGCL